MGDDADTEGLIASGAERGDWRDRLAFGPIRLAAVILPVALAFGFSAWSWQQVQGEAHDRATRTVALLHEHMVRSLEVKDAIIAALQARIETMSWAEIAASREVWSLMSRLDDATPSTNRLGLIDPDGMLVQMSSVFPLAPKFLGDRDYVAALRDATRDVAVVGAPVTGFRSSLHVVPYARPRLLRDGRPDGGVIWSSLLPASFTQLFERVAGPGDAILLVRDDGTVLVRHPDGIGEKPARMPADSAAMRAATAAQAAGAEAGAFYASGRSPLDGRDRLHAARRVGDVGIAVVYARSIADIRGEWMRQTMWMLALAAMTSGLLLFLTTRGQLAVRREIRAQLQAREAAEQRAAAEAVRADMEAMLRHAQRMEVLGQVAAGLVHDFRNTVQAVHSGVMLIERATAQGDAARVREVTRLVRDAVDRAGQLTQRLLAHGRMGGAPAQCDPVETVTATCRLLQSALGPRFRLVHRFDHGLPSLVAAGAAELDAALVNLIINARDAMPEGGEIVLAVRTMATGPGQAAGRYVEISVTDTGAGMDQATLARATEAFFTTKGQDGTGLGLASINAFVSEAGGTMVLRSTEGEGTTVTLWLPAAPEPDAADGPDIR